MPKKLTKSHIMEHCLSCVNITMRMKMATCCYWALYHWFESYICCLLNSCNQTGNQYLMTGYYMYTYTENFTKWCRSSNWSHCKCCIPTAAWPITTSDILFAITRFVLYIVHVTINLRHKKNRSNCYEKLFTKQINQWSIISNNSDIGSWVFKVGNWNWCP